MAIDDYRADGGTVGFLDPGGSLLGRAEGGEEADVDWVRTTLVAGEHYRVNAALDYGGVQDLAAYDAAGRPVAIEGLRNLISGQDGVISPTRTGTHYLAVTTGADYTLSLGRVFDDIGNTNATAAPARFVPRGAYGTYNYAYGDPGAIDFAGDADRFAAPVRAGFTYTFTLETGPFDSGEGTKYADDGRLSLYGADGRPIGQATTEFGQTTVTYAAAQNGVVYAEATASGSTGAYYMNVREALPRGDPGTTTAKALAIGPVAGGRYLETELTAGGADVFAFTLTKPASLLVNENLPGAAGPQVTILQQTGGGTKTLAPITPQYGDDLYATLTAGTYYAQVKGAAGYAGPYAFGLETLPDAGNDFASAVNLGVLDRFRTGEDVNLAKDNDMYRFELKGPTNLGLSLSGGAANTDLYLYDRPVWNTAIASTAGRGEKELDLAGLKAGTYYVGVYSPNGAAAPYTLNVGPYGRLLSDDHAATTTTSGFVAAGGSVAGRIDGPGDEDWIKVDLKAGTTYAFDAEGAATGKGTLADPELVLRDGTGGWLAFADAGGSGTNARLTFKAETSGVHILSVADHGHADAGTYRVGVTAQAAPTPSPAPPASPVGTPRNDVLVGTAGADLVRLGDGDDRINARAGNDELYGDNGADLLFGEDGDDVLWGGAGRDTLDGGTGNDFLAAGPDVDRLTGGGGNDAIRLDARHVLSGADVLTDFARGDRITITGVFSGGGTVRATAAGNGADVLVDLDGGGSAHGARAIVHLDYASAASLIVTDDQQGNAVIALR